MKIFSAYKEGRLTLYLHGELDHHGVKNSMDLIDKLIDEFMPKDCIIELSKLSFMDSSGIALILKVHKRMYQRGGRAWVENADSQPLRVIDASGIDRIMKIGLSKEVMK